MSLTGINNLSTTQVNVPQQPVNTGEVHSKSTNLSEIASNVQVQSHPEPRIHRSAGQILGRIALGIVTAGLSELVIAIVNKVRSGETEGAQNRTINDIRQENLQNPPSVNAGAVAQEEQPVQELDNRQFNNQLTYQMREGSQLSGEYANAMKEGLEVIKEKFPNQFGNTDTLTFENLPRKSWISGNINTAITHSQERVTPEMFKEIVIQSAVETLVMDSMTKMLKEQGVPYDAVDRFLPGFEKAVMEQKDFAGIKAVFDQNAQRLDQAKSLHATAQTLYAEAKNQLAQAMGEALGLNPEALKTAGGWNHKVETLNKAMKGMTLETTPEQLKTAFDNQIQSIVSGLKDTFNAIDELKISQALKDDLKNFCLTDKEFAKMLPHIVNEAKVLSNSFAKSFLSEVQSLDPKSDMVAFLFSAGVKKAAGQVIQGTGINDRDAWLTAGNLAMKIAMDLNPNLGKVFNMFPDLFDECAKTFETHGVSDFYVSNAQVALMEIRTPNFRLQGAIQRGQDLPPLYQDALLKAESNLGRLANFSGEAKPGNVLDIQLRNGQTVREALVDQLGKQKTLLSAADFTRLVTQIAVNG